MERRNFFKTMGVTALSMGAMGVGNELLAAETQSQTVRT